MFKDELNIIDLLWKKFQYFNPPKISVLAQENYFLYQLTIQIKVAFQIILSSSYEIVSLLLYTVT